MSHPPKHLVGIAQGGFWLAALSALLVLAAGPGHAAGWWSFRTGFFLLRWGAYQGAFAGCYGLGVLLADRRKALLRWALPSIPLGIMALAIPWNYQSLAKAAPAIHDITTDTDDPPRFVAALEIRKASPNPSEYGGPEIAAKQKAAYPELRPLVLPDAPEQAFDKALAAAKSLGWEILAAVPAEGRIEATDTTRWFRFKDDVVIRVRPKDVGSIVDARSVSRVGRGDVGTNARRLRRFLGRVAGTSDSN